jgi:hypothetical protein
MDGLGAEEQEKCLATNFDSQSALLLVGVGSGGMERGRGL